MKKFLIVYRMDMAEMKKFMSTMTPEDQKRDMAEWGAWMQKNMAHFADPGGPVGKNTEISVNGAAEKSNDVAGYSIVKGESKEAVIAMLTDGPHLKMPGSKTDVMEIVEMPEM